MFFNNKNAEMGNMRAPDSFDTWEDIPGWVSPEYSSPDNWGYGGGSSYQEPIFDAPIYQEPAYQEPIYQAPVYQAPINTGNNLDQKYASKFSEMQGKLAEIDSNLSSGAWTPQQAQDVLGSFHQNWQNYKFSVPEKEQGYLYSIEVSRFKAVWDALQGKINAAFQQQTQNAAQQQPAQSTSQTTTSSQPAQTTTSSQPAQTTSQTTTTNQTPGTNTNTGNSQDQWIEGIDNKFVLIGAVVATFLLLS